MFWRETGKIENGKARFVARAFPFLLTISAVGSCVQGNVQEGASKDPSVTPEPIEQRAYRVEQEPVASESTEPAKSTFDTEARPVEPGETLDNMPEPMTLAEFRESEFIRMLVRVNHTKPEAK